MFRRCVIGCLLVGYLAGQLAAVPHEHAYEHDQGHEGRAHAHIGWLVPAMGVAQHLHAEGHSHQHTAPLPASGEGDHDHDLVYLPDSEAANIGKVAALDSPLSEAAVRAHLAAECLVPSCRTADLQKIPPADLFAGCDLFLKLRTLRI